MSRRTRSVRRPRRHLRAEALEMRALLAADAFSSFQNAALPTDVNGDGVVSAIDALMVLNELDAGGARALASNGLASNGAVSSNPTAFAAALAPTAMVDVSGDNMLSAVDALMVLNQIDSDPQVAAVHGGNLHAVDDARDTTESAVIDEIAPGLLGNDTLEAGGTLEVTGFDAMSTLGAEVNVNADGSFTYNPRNSDTLRALADAETAMDTFTYTASDGLGETATATVTVTVTGQTDQVLLSLDTTDLDGSPITGVEVGDRFLLVAGVTDIRPGGGVFSAFLDIDFDSALADVVGRETQRVLLTGAPISGTFTLTFDGETTGPIAVSADPEPADVRDALEALSNIPAGSIDVIVKVTDTGETFWEVKFGGSFAGTNVPDMTADSSMLVGAIPTITPMVEISELNGVDLTSATDYAGAFSFTKYLRGRTAASGPDGIDEAGALTEDRLGFFPQELFTVVVEATSAGTLDFIGGPADEMPFHDITVFGEEDPVAPGRVVYESASLAVVNPFAAVADVEDVASDSMDTIINVLDNDEAGLGGAPLTLVSVSGTTGGGTATQVGNTVEYDAPGGSVADTFTYVVQNGLGATDTGTVTVNVGATGGPNAGPDTNSTDEETPVGGNVLTNDTDPDMDDISVTAFDATSAEGAAVTVAANGDYTYDPSGSAMLDALAADETAIDTFTYTIEDVGGLSDVGTVTVTVTGLNDDPNADGDLAGTNEDTAIMGNVLANDTDPDASDVLTVIDSDTLSVFGASVSVAADGSFTYNPVAAIALQSLSGAESESDSFQYTVSDGNGGTDTATVTINVTGIDDAPDAVSDTLSTDEDNTASVTTGELLSDDTDVEDDPIAPTFVGFDDTLTVGSVSQVGDTITYDPDGQFESLPFGGTATDSFTYTIEDLDGLTDTATVAITIDGVNDDPDADLDLRVANNMSTTTLEVLGNDTDPDTGDVLMITGVTPGSANGTTTVVTVDGVDMIDYTPVDLFGTDMTTETFTYTVDDGNGGTDTATVTVTVLANQPPVADSDSDGTDENTPTTIDVLDNDTDPEGDTLTISDFDLLSAEGASITSGPGGLTYDPTSSSTLNALAAGVIVTDTFTYTIEDTVGGTDTATVTVTVTGVNDAPVATGDGDSTDEDTPITIDVLDNDTDVDSDPLSIGLGSTTSDRGAAISVVAGGVSYDPTVSAELQGLLDGVTVSDSFTYTIDDGNGGTDTATVSLTVTGVNDDPTATDNEFTVIKNAGVQTFDVLFDDTALPDLGESLSIIGVTQGDFGGEVLITGGGTGLSYESDLDFSGPEMFTYTIGDGNGGTDTATVTVIVLDFVPGGAMGNAFVDANNDGYYSPGVEQPLAGITVTLEPVDVPLDPSAATMTTVTGADGSYDFGEVVPGLWLLTQEQATFLFDGIDTMMTPAVNGTPASESTVSDSTLLEIPQGAVVGVNFGEWGFDLTSSAVTVGIQQLLASTPDEGFIIATESDGSEAWYTELGGWEGFTYVASSVDTLGGTVSLTVFDEAAGIERTTVIPLTDTARICMLADGGGHMFHIVGTPSDFFPPTDTTDEVFAAMGS